MPSNKPGSKLIKAAGGVAWRPGPDGKPEILLVHRKKYDDWSLPKGKTEPGEKLPVTAVREVMEEGGARLALGRRLASVRYSVGGRPKRVHYWVARVLSVDAQAVPNSEVDEVTWLPADRAVDKVSYAHDHGVLADFAARPPGTVPLILLRHAKAHDKHGWKRDDAVRPLTDAGRGDAKTLADLLACFAPQPRLISSTAARCLDTLRPFSHLTGEPVREEPSLYIHSKSARTGAADSADPLVTLVREVIAAGEPAVLCAHRENIPHLRRAALAALASLERDGAADDPAGLAELPREWDEPLPTAGFWVLNIAPAPPGTDAPGPGDQDGEAGREDPAGRGDRASRDDALLQAPGRRWWQRIRARSAARALAPAADGADAGPGPAPGLVPADPAQAAADPARPAADPAQSAGEPSQPAAGLPGAGLPGAGRPAGRLISADRYDLSES
jgi:8-oxo-dGTP pyrophosphatase MutT (NUDIX family)/phosphohistidine phosphatase SixA